MGVREVRVSARRQNREILISVSDRGVGISPEDQKGLFEPFSKIVAPGSPSQGVGLGLDVSRRLVEAQGGQIGLESQLGKGSTFFFTTPVNYRRAAADNAAL